MVGTSGHKNGLDFMWAEVLLLLSVAGFLGIFIQQCFAWVCMWACVWERQGEETKRHKEEIQRGRDKERSN